MTFSMQSMSAKLAAVHSPPPPALLATVADLVDFPLPCAPLAAVGGLATIDFSTIVGPFASYASPPYSHLSGSSSTPLPNVFHMLALIIGIIWEEEKAQFGCSSEASEKDDSENENV